MSGETLVALLWGLLVWIAFLGLVDRVDWRRAWDEIFADAWFVQAGRSIYASIVGATLGAGVMVAGLSIQAIRSVRSWWREKVFLPPRAAIETFARATGRGDEDTMVFISEVGILEWRLLLWLAITAVAATFRQLHAEKAEAKRAFVAFAALTDADDRFCVATLVKRHETACEAAKLAG